jgi:hypothetical protein
VALTDSLNVLLGADVAASDDDTGHAQYNADWDLEYSIGEIEATVVFTAELQAAWEGKLATITVDTFLDVVDGGDGMISLREAIDMATAGDTIQLSAGTYDLAIPGTADDLNVSGDLDITTDVNIVGVGTGVGGTTIDGNDVDRVFHVLSGTVTFSNLTIMGGDAGVATGGGVLVDATSNLSLSEVIVTNTTTSEETQSTSGLQITPAAGDASVTHFRLTGISNGTLYLNDGVTQVNNGSFITASAAASGLKFTPNAGFKGVTSFEVRASTNGAVSGPGLSAAATATVTVSPVANTPTVSGTTVVENTQSTSGLVILPNAADGPEVTHFKITGITNGQLFQNDGVTLINDDEFLTVAAGAAGLRFTPATDFFGTAQFQVQASISAFPSGLGGSLATAAITVTSANQQPTAIAIPDYIGSEDDGQVTLPMAPYFSDPDGDDLTYTMTVVNGTPGIFERLTIDALNGNVTVEPNENQFGAVDVRVTATDAEGLSVPADFTITIQPVNDRPIVSDVYYVMPAGGTLSVAAPGVLGAASDADGNPLMASMITAPGNGTMVFNPDGSFSWTPEDNYAGTASFTFIATDGTLDSSVATVTISVTGGVAPPPALAGNDSEASESESESESDGDEVVTPDESATAQPDGPSLSGSATSPSDGSSQTNQSETDGAALLLLQQRDDAAFTLAAIGEVDAAAAGRLEATILDSSNFQQHSGHDTALRSLSGKVAELAATHLRTQFYSQFSDDTGAFSQSLDEFEDGIASELNFDRAVIGSVTAVGSGLAVGSVIWAVRSGLLLSGLLAQMPIWTMFDPLMVIDGVTGDEEDGDSIQDIVDRQPEKPSEPELTCGTG